MRKKADQSNQNTAMPKFVDFCEAHSLHKTDEELANSFNSFLVYEDTLDDAAKEENLKSLKALEELMPVLYDLAHELKKS